MPLAILATNEQAAPTGSTARKPETHLMSTLTKSPDPKRIKADEAALDEEGGGDADECEDVKSMFKSMMQMMKSVKGEVAEMRRDASDVRRAVDEAKRAKPAEAFALSSPP